MLHLSLQSPGDANPRTQSQRSIIRSLPKRKTPGCGVELLHNSLSVGYGINAMPERFFRAVIVGSRLRPNGIPAWGPWDASRLHWWTEGQLELNLKTIGYSKVRTKDDLEAALTEPPGVTPPRTYGFTRA